MGGIGVKLAHSIEFFRKEGFLPLLRETQAYVVNGYYERRLGVRTKGLFRLTDLGIQQPLFHDSMPIHYRAFYSAIHRLNADVGNSTFIDIGCGAGRALCAAAALPFRRVIGVEFSPELARIAEQNLSRMKRRRAVHTQVHVADASEFTIPPDVNVMYFYNPFRGDILQKVIANIRESLRLDARRIHIAFFNNDHFDRLIPTEPWLRKTFQTEFHPQISCGLYETTEAVERAWMEAREGTANRNAARAARP